MASEAEVPPISPEEVSSVEAPSEDKESVAEESPAPVAEETETVAKGENEAASNADEAKYLVEAAEEAAAEEEPEAISDDIGEGSTEEEDGEDRSESPEPGTSSSKEQENDASDEKALQLVAEAIQGDARSVPEASSTPSKKSTEDMKDIEGGLASEDDSIEDPTKASVAGLVTETASSVSSMDVDKDLQTVASQESDSTSPRRTQASSLSQIFALIRKNILTKLRTPGATTFELFSPVLMMLVLSAAYTLTEIEYEDAATYASINLSFPGPWIDIAQRSTELFNANNDIAGAMSRRRKLKRSTHGRDDPNLLVQMTT
ncbi:MAG: hypothetical protein SGBAC_008419, partial [Bacillariaceae sp.]